MMRHRHVGRWFGGLGLAQLLLMGAPYGAQTGPDPAAYLRVERWNASLTRNATSESVRTVSGTRTQSSSTMTATVQLERRHDAGAGEGVWEGTATVQCSVRLRRDETSGSWEESEYTGGSTAAAILYVRAEGFYELLLNASDDIQGTSTSFHRFSNYTRGPVTTPSSGPCPSFNLAKGRLESADVRPLSGADRREDRSPAPIATTTVEAGTWSITPAGLSPPDVTLEVFVEDEEYRNWLPQAGADEQTAGSWVGVRAELRGRNGGPATEPAEKIGFMLMDVSRQPGIAMNAPLRPSASPRPDLNFSPAFNPNLVFEDENQAAETTPGQHYGATAVVAAYDYGAWGEVHAYAVLRDGRIIYGQVRGGARALLLPKRQPSSKIADSYKELFTLPAGAADDADDENTPESHEDHYGDGLSLYEEYRGFLVNGKHQWGDGSVKDYFIRDELGGGVKTGIALFQALTGMQVHHELARSELREDRVVNFNHGYAHRVDQHGVIIRRGDQEGYAVANDGPGPPRMVSSIETWHSYNPALAELNYGITSEGPVRVDLIPAVVAHELLHASSVWHHGEGDLRSVSWTFDGARWIEKRSLDDDTTVSNPVDVMLENGQPVATTLSPITAGMLGTREGQHSGDGTCVMRYFVSSGYRADPEATSRIRYFTGADDVPGFAICRRPTGTEINDAGRRPQSRYGNAQSASPARRDGDGPPARGNCLAQVCVNDAKRHAWESR